MKPLVSIVVPCYNVEKYVVKCVDSILENDYDNIEVFLVDDGSTDGTGCLIAPYAADPRVTVVTKPNGGLSSARNAGLDRSCGAYVLFIDSDDWIAPTYISSAVAVMERESCDILAINIMLMVYQLNGDVTRSPQGIKMPLCYTHEQVMQKAFAGLIGLSRDDVLRWGQTGSLDRLRVHGYAAAKMYRRDLLEAHRIRFDETVGFREDVYFNLHCLIYTSKTAAVEEPLYFYRIRKDGTNSVGRTDVSPVRAYSEKVQGVQLRSELRDLVLRVDGVDIRSMYCGSLVLSVIEVALCCARDAHNLGLPSFLSYYSSEVRECVKAVPLRASNLKFNGPLALMKAHAQVLVYAAVKTFVLLGLDGKISASGIKDG